MRRLFLLTALTASLISSAVFIGTGSSQALPGTGGVSARTHCPRDSVAGSYFTPPNPQIVPYLSDNPLLGPKDLPRHGTIGKILAGYKRFHGNSPDAFLSCYWSSYNPHWRYPTENGFKIVHGNPVKYTVVLNPGQEIDLFGNPGDPADPTAHKGGQFLSPADTSYKARALPPTNLDTYAASAPFNYHLYKVLKQFSVTAGPIAPWFDQPGGGTQDYLGDTTEPDLPQSPGIANLVSRHYVEELPVGT